MSTKRPNFQIHTEDGETVLVGQRRGSGPALVVQAPGWGCGGALFEQTLRPLAAHFTVITYDPRGSGSSTRDVEANTIQIEQQARDLQHLCDTLELRRVYALGHSHGSWILLRAALEKPDTFAALVLVGAEIDHLPGFEEAQRTFITQRAHQSETWRRAAEIMIHHLQTGFNDIDSDAAMTRWFNDVMPLYAACPERLRNAFKETTLPPFAARTFVASAFSNANYPVSARLHTLQTPTLIVTGNEDFSGLIQLSDALESRLPTASRLRLPQAGHFPWLEQSEPFFQGVHAFLTSQRSKA